MGKNPNNYFTININDYDVDWSKVNVNSTTYNFSYTIDSDPILEYDRIDAEFDALEDQTSVAREMLKGMGYNVND
jgi:hypothetical protein